MRWRAKGKMAEMGTVTPLGLWKRKHTHSEGRFDAHPCWPGGTLETRRSENITDLACPFSTCTSVRHPKRPYEVVLASVCHTCYLVSFRPPRHYCFKWHREVLVSLAGSGHMVL